MLGKFISQIIPHFGAQAGGGEGYGFLEKKWFMNVIEKHDFQKTEAKKIKGRNIYKKGGKKLSEAVG